MTGKEPTEADIYMWIRIDGDLSDHLAVRHTCPNCHSKRTRWVSNQYCVCYDCISWFTVEEAIRASDAEDNWFWKQF